MTKRSKSERLLERLVEAAAGLGIEVRYENLPRPGYTGGLCRVREKWFVILNKGAPVDEKVEAIVAAIATRDTEGVFLQPDVRALVDRVRGPAQVTEPDPESRG